MDHNSKSISRFLSSFLILLCLIAAPQFAFAGGGDLPALALTLSCPAKASKGQIVTCEAKIINNTGHDYWEIRLTGPRPGNGITLLSDGLSPECSISNNAPKCSFKSLNKQQMKNYWFKYKINTDASCGGQIMIQIDVNAKDAETNWAKAHIMISCEDLPECSDYVDNDGDGWIDFPEDKDCTSPHDDKEAPDPECTYGQTRHLSCNTGFPGICTSGKKISTCNHYGKWGPYEECKPDIIPGTVAEVCNDGKDNDCDGLKDLQDSECAECWPGETQTTDCSTGHHGVCAAGKKTRSCHNGWWGPYGSCQPYTGVGQQQEQCNDGKDNDCDGKIDAQDSNCFQCQPGTKTYVSCYTGIPGICGTGKIEKVCQSNGVYGAPSECKPIHAPGSQFENCTDHIDNDCDGHTDGQDPDCYSNDECKPGESDSRVCTTGLKGICASGLQHRKCMYGGQWGDFGDCYAVIYPHQQVEACGDNKDNDCDGDTDESCHSSPYDYKPTCTVTHSLFRERLELDSLRKYAHRSSKYVRNQMTGRRGESTNAKHKTAMFYAKSTDAECNQLYNNAMTISSKFPDRYQKCNHSACAMTDYTEPMHMYEGIVKDMVTHTRKLSRMYNRAMRTRSRKLLRIRKLANREKKSIFSEMHKLPSTSYRCE